MLIFVMKLKNGAIFNLHNQTSSIYFPNQELKLLIFSFSMENDVAYNLLFVTPILFF